MTINLTIRKAATMPAKRRNPALVAVSSGRKPKLPAVMTPELTDDPPEWLPPAGKAEWHRVMEVVARTGPGFLQQLDRAALTAYASTWSTFTAAAQDVAERGPLVPGRSSADAARGDGTPVLVKNPSVAVARDAGIQLRAWCQALGFTPASRDGLHLPGPPETEKSRFLS